MFWQKDAETMSRAKIKEVQLEKLKWTVGDAIIITFL
jgi:phenylacetate-coenzyme A ligase PaaK-like adenylate-forming protein